MKIFYLLYTRISQIFDWYTTNLLSILVAPGNEGNGNRDWVKARDRAYVPRLPEH